MMNEVQKRRFADALARLSGDEALLASLATITSEDAPGLLAQMNRHLEAGDLADYAHTAHALKGLLSTFETNDPVKEMQPLIDAARQSDADKVESQHISLHPKLESLLGEITALC
jgi:HPt (histidine-containing phosphotransfer) domain-containing protein